MFTNSYSRKHTYNNLHLGDHHCNSKSILQMSTTVEITKFRVILGRQLIISRILITASYNKITIISLQGEILATAP